MNGGLPFAGLKVLDMSRLLAGPFCGQMLSDMGADVTKVEPPAGDDSRHLGPPFIEGSGIFFHSANGGKRSVVLDLRRPDDHQALLRLAAGTDVVIENFRPGGAAALNVAYDDIRAVRPDVVYCSISGFGAEGPLSDRSGVDTVFQAMSGIMTVIARDGDGPMKIGSPVADIAAAQWASFAISSALYRRNRTGQGGHIQVSIRDSLISLLAPVFTYALLTGENPPNWGNASQFAAPADIFRTSDGHLALSIINDRHWRLLCRRIGREELADDPRFARPQDRIDNRSALTVELQGILAASPTAEWVRALNEDGIPAGPIATLVDLVDDAQLRANGFIVRAGELPSAGPPFRMDGSGVTARAAAPKLGEHSKAIIDDRAASEGPSMSAHGSRNPIPDDGEESGRDPARPPSGSQVFNA